MAGTCSGQQPTSSLVDRWVSHVVQQTHNMDHHALSVEQHESLARLLPQWAALVQPTTSSSSSTDAHVGTSTAAITARWSPEDVEELISCCSHDALLPDGALVRDDLPCITHSPLSWSRTSINDDQQQQHQQQQQLHHHHPHPRLRRALLIISARSHLLHHLCSIYVAYCAAHVASAPTNDDDDAMMHAQLNNFVSAWRSSVLMQNEVAPRRKCRREDVCAAVEQVCSATTTTTTRNNNNNDDDDDDELGSCAGPYSSSVVLETLATALFVEVALVDARGDALSFDVDLIQTSSLMSVVAYFAQQLRRVLQQLKQQQQQHDDDDVVVSEPSTSLMLNVGSISALALQPPTTLHRASSSSSRRRSREDLLHTYQVDIAAALLTTYRVEISVEHSLPHVQAQHVLREEIVGRGGVLRWSTLGDSHRHRQALEKRVKG